MGPGCTIFKNIFKDYIKIVRETRSLTSGGTLIVLISWKMYTFKGTYSFEQNKIKFTF